MLNDEFTVVGGEVIENPVKGALKRKLKTKRKEKQKRNVKKKIRTDKIGTSRGLQTLAQIKHG